jgi:hypothetical protein
MPPGARRLYDGTSFIEGGTAMAAKFEQASNRRGSRWRVAGWGMAALLLLLPFLAMQVTDDVVWGAGDFIAFGMMLGVAGGMVELAARISGNGFYRAGVGAAVAACFLLVWVNLAVGFLGSEDNDANLMFAGVIAVAVGGSIVAHFRAAGMSKAMIAAAVAQALVGIIGLAAGLASPGPEDIYEVVLGTTLFSGLWLLSASLFSQAAKKADNGSRQPE